MSEPTLRRVAIVGGARIPFCRSNTKYSHQSNQDLLTASLKALYEKYDPEREQRLLEQVQMEKEKLRRIEEEEKNKNKTKAQQRRGSVQTGKQLWAKARAANNLRQLYGEVSVAQAATLQPITDIAKKILSDDDVKRIEPYGRYKVSERANRASKI